MQDSVPTKQLSNIEEFLTLCEKASLRSRNVLISLVFATVIMFGGTWKQLDSSWFEVDVLKWKQAQQYMALNEQVKADSAELKVCDKLAADVDALTSCGASCKCAGNRCTPKSLLSDARCGRLSAIEVGELSGAMVIDGCETQQTSRNGNEVPCSVDKKPLSSVGLLVAGLRRDQWFATWREMNSELRYRANALSSELKWSRSRLEDGDTLRIGRVKAEDVLGGTYEKSSPADIQVANQEIDSELEGSRRIRHENELLVHIPTFGIAFHINDLGIIGGFAIFVMLLWMRASLDEEKYGLQAARDEMLAYAKGHGLNVGGDDRKAFFTSMYRRLSMQQFFFRPQSVEDAGEKFSLRPESVGSQALRYAALLLLCLPVTFEASLFLVDYQADRIIFDENRTGYRATLICSGAFLALNIVLTAFAVRSAYGQFDFWRALAKSIEPLKPATELLPEGGSGAHQNK